MKITISIPKQPVATASGAYSAPDMGTAEQLQYSDQELAERDREEKARQEKEAEEERKAAAEKQKKDAKKAPQTPAESGEETGDSGDEEEEESDDGDDGDDSDDSDDGDDSEDDESEDDEEEEEDDEEDDEEATASATPEPYPNVKSSRKESDVIPVESAEKVVDPAVEEEEKEKREAEANKAREFSKDDPNAKQEGNKKLDDSDTGNTLVATASSIDFTIPYQDVKLRNR
uniref:Uncharacterized protein n=1 Tax=Pseudomonas phage HRDY3 TaxID=3236930 RepID=A0AB39CDR8_9VIRU